MAIISETKSQDRAKGFFWFLFIETHVSASAPIFIPIREKYLSQFVKNNLSQFVKRSSTPSPDEREGSKREGKRHRQLCTESVPMMAVRMATTISRTFFHEMVFMWFNGLFFVKQKV